MANLIATISHQAQLLGWAAHRLGNEGPWAWGADAVAMAAIDKSSSKIVAVTVLNAFFDDSCYVHIVSDGSGVWASRHILRCFFGFMFDARKVSRVIGITPSDNPKAIAAVIKMGFTIEGRIRSSRDGKKADIVSTMFREDCPWLDQPPPEGVPNHGEEVRTSA